MNNIMNFALNLLRSNPNVANNPQSMEYVNILQSGDVLRGQQVATNLCNTYGISKEEAVNNAKRFFNI